MNRRIAIIVLWFFAAMLVVAAVLGWLSMRGAENDPESAVGKLTQNVRVANIGVYSIFNVIAQDQGFFLDHGLHAEIDEFDTGTPSVKAVTTGEADVGITSDFSVLMAAFERNDIKVIAAVSDQDVFKVFGLKDRGIAAPKDLKGKRVGVTRGTIGEFFLGRFLLLNGLSLAEVTEVDLAPAAMIEGMKKGTIDAMVIFQPHVFRVEREFGDTVTSWSAQGTSRATALAFTTASFAGRHPDVVEAYLRVLVDAEKFARENPQRARRIVATRLGLDEAYLAAVWPQFDFTIGMSQELIVSLEGQGRWAIEAGRTTRKTLPDFTSMLYYPAIDAVKPESVSVIRPAR